MPNFLKVKHTNTLNKIGYKHLKNCITVIESVRKVQIKLIPAGKDWKKLKNI